MDSRNNQGETKTHNISLTYTRATMDQIPNWTGCDIHSPSKCLTSSSAQRTHNRANDDQISSLLPHATVHPMLAHVSCRAPRRAYTHSEPHVRATDQDVPVAVKVGSGTICNAPVSKRLNPLCCMLSEPHLPPSHLRFRACFP
jgi:hypothetical protein